MSESDGKTASEENLWTLLRFIKPNKLFCSLFERIREKCP